MISKFKPFHSPSHNVPVFSDLILNENRLQRRLSYEGLSAADMLLLGQNNHVWF